METLSLSLEGIGKGLENMNPFGGHQKFLKNSQLFYLKDTHFPCIIIFSHDLFSILFQPSFSECKIRDNLKKNEKKKVTFYFFFF